MTQEYNGLHHRTDYEAFKNIAFAILLSSSDHSVDTYEGLDFNSGSNLFITDTK